MQWWQHPEFRQYLDSVLEHAAEAVNVSKSSRATQVCEIYFRALNKLWNAFAHHEGDAGRADIPSFKSLLQSLSEDYRSVLLRNEALVNLVKLTPDVLNHHLLKSRGYRPGQEMTDALIRDATEEHRKLRNAHGAFMRATPDSSTESVLKKLAEFLYVVRSNIAHGEKSPYGRDPEKSKRDEIVCALVVPVQKLILELLFDRPTQRLVAYGTLCPGGVNEWALKGLTGDWQPCRICGSIREEGSLRYFRWEPQRAN